ncbi:CCHC-type domain-containing protein [Trichonephila clavipes]|nr:CCHC-type domain-containing protein [Trichonephila clavipes]
MDESSRNLNLTSPKKIGKLEFFFRLTGKSLLTQKGSRRMAEILLKILGDKTSSVLVHIKEDLREYAKVKTLILKEFEPTPQACLENFRIARRHSREMPMQLVHFEIHLNM